MIDFDQQEKEIRFKANLRNARVLSLVDIEKYLVSTLEAMAEETKGMLDWSQTNQGIQELRELAKKRIEEDFFLSSTEEIAKANELKPGK
jgi:hypothetical protein